MFLLSRLLRLRHKLSQLPLYDCGEAFTLLLCERFTLADDF